MAFKLGEQVFIDFSVSKEAIRPGKNPIRPNLETFLANPFPNWSFYGKLDISKMIGKEILAHRISTSANRKVKKLKDQMVFWGTISAIEEESNIISVQMEASSVEQCHGYRFWQQYADSADTARCNKKHMNPEVKLTHMRRWATGADEDRCYRFKIDRSVRVIRNGIVEQSFADLKVGDIVTAFYQPNYEQLRQENNIIYPKRLLATSLVNLKR